MRSAREAAGYRFRGYRIEEDGSTTILYNAGSTEVEDRLVPLDGGGGLKRVMTLRGDRENLYFRGIEEGAQPEPVDWRDGEATIEESIEW